MKVIIVDDDGLIRDSLKLLIDLETDMEVIGTAKNGMEAFELCKAEQPDIVLMDIRMPVMDGVLGTKLIKESFQHIKVVMLTTFKDDEYIREAILNGAEGYILKNQSSDSIIDSLRTVFKGNAVFEKDIINSITGMLKEEKKNKPSSFGLSEREFETLALIAEGMSNKEIAEKLFLGEGTVRNYITNILEKLSLRDRTQLAIFYLKNF
ncbi:response regulator transcription factor [Clostridium sp. YIM B02505]|uniref:Stage 0 sporulation protein A homolog n=1 Tax=Clostridium yunnanense TaxID=2800325 RepID=A0ABS1EMY8_9CLOT|nr:response regulator transcription factor [Clostridium yunnanense]MBK1810729.1 response regulator transcription factor [Clostridium yunnanense]